MDDKYVAGIKTGDRAGVKIAAYGGTRYEYMDGRVVSIGNAAVNTQTHGPVYEVCISVRDMPGDIRAGMEGNCDIITGQRSILEYFLDPFLDGLDKSMKEK